MGAMYCQPSDIRDNVAGTDAGTGTCAALEDYQLNAAIAQASAKVSAYVGTTYEVDTAATWSGMSPSKRGSLSYSDSSQMPDGTSRRYGQEGHGRLRTVISA
jgi:hypothetical protein